MDALVEDGLHDAWDYSAGEDLRGANAVFGLIGSPGTSDDGAARHGHGSDGAMMTGMTDGRDLFQTLHEQYCLALDDPRASLDGSWAAQWTIPFAEESALNLHEDHHRRHETSTGRESTGMESIEALLSGAYALHDVFGALGEGEMAGLADTGPVPEILQLFAPAGYHAAASRRSGARPPVFARREHHTPGIDSSMPMPSPASNPRRDVL
ncbi:TagK domain-containing protein [Paraburkholderia sediminicola]|nr:TagK domain-containing protein [Paraburkholderia sediminicola]